MGESERQKLLRKPGLFLAITFGVAWGGYFTAWGCGQRYGDANFDIVLVLGSLAPLAAMFICRKQEGYGFDPELWGLAPHFKGNFLTYGFGYVFPTALALVAGLLFFTMHPQQYDPQGETFIAGLIEGGMTREQASGVFSSLLGMGVLAGPFANILLSAAELLGFQGYLLPKAQELFGKNAPMKAALACSGVWALWYAPLFFDGYFYGRAYGGFPVLGLLTGLLFYFLLGLSLSYMTLRTGSILPAALSRSGVTAMAAAGIYFAKGEVGLLTGPGLYGVFGCLGLLLFGALFLLRIRRIDRAGKLYAQRAKKQKTLPATGQAKG